MASTRAGTMDLTVDSTGLGVTARMANTTQASDMHELVRSGNLDKMSFAFTVAKDAFDPKTNTRTIFSFDKIYDVSVVDFPAYEQTTVSARSYVKAQQELEARRLQSIKEEEAKAQEAKDRENQRRIELRNLLFKTRL
ncbi:Phage prohead protease HK97 family protein (fragment) [Candidatus Desulfosporosinus infrequens]|uniref:Phage prohead protease HK97 family protein n=1 Tax=Candidatus Desulfosporosinus infrequens TaxID=2043169 RepID=A0A2U3L8E7_9FIRM